MLGTTGHSGPSANFLRLFAEGSSNLDLTLLTAAPQLLPPPPGARYIRIARTGDDGSALNQAVLVIRSIFWLIRHRKQFDVFYGISAFLFSVIPAYAAHLMGRRVVIRPSTGYDFVPRKGGALARLRSAAKTKIISRLDGIVAINPFVQSAAAKYGLAAAQICFCRNGVDVMRFRDTPSPRNRLGDVSALPLAIVHTGGWDPRKGLHVVLAAIRQLRNQGLRVELIVAGPKKDALYTAEIESLVCRWELRDVIVEKGFVPQIEDIYATGDVFVLPSVSEGMPNALIEAMASGLPAIVTALPGIDDVVRHDVEGFLLRLADEEAMSNELATYLELYARSKDLRRRHGCAGRERAVAEFNASVTKQKIEAFLCDKHKYRPLAS